MISDKWHRNSECAVLRWIINTHNLCRQSEWGDGILHFFHINNVNLSAMEARPSREFLLPASRVNRQEAKWGCVRRGHPQTGLLQVSYGSLQNRWQLIVSKLESTPEKDSQRAKFFILLEKGAFRWKKKPKITEKYPYHFVPPGFLKSITAASGVKETASQLDWWCLPGKAKSN